MDREKKYTFGVFIGAIALIAIMLITSIIDIIEIAHVNKKIDEKNENIIQSTNEIDNVEKVNNVLREE